MAPVEERLLPPHPHGREPRDASSALPAHLPQR